MPHNHLAGADTLYILVELSSNIVFFTIKPHNNQAKFLTFNVTYDIIKQKIYYPVGSCKLTVSSFALGWEVSFLAIPFFIGKTLI